MFVSVTSLLYETNNSLNQFPRKFLLTHAMLLILVTSVTPGLLISHAKAVFNKFLFLVKVCALHFKQLLACLAKRLISIAIYDRITQRIEWQK